VPRNTDLTDLRDAHQSAHFDENVKSRLLWPFEIAREIFCAGSSKKEEENEKKDTVH
jgi:hypothetical protein